MASYRAPRIASRITRLLFSLFIFSVCGILVWRVFFSTKIPKELDSLLPNETLCEAYAENNGVLTLQYQELSTISRAKDSYGYFSVVSYVFIPEADQVQLVFRYNNSTIRHLQEDYGLSELPKKSDHLFDVTLVVSNDPTPEDHTDDYLESGLETTRIFPSAEPLREETSLYTFYRYVFDGVSVEEITNSVYVDVYYTEDIHYEERPYSTLLLYAWDETWFTRSLSKAESKLLATEN